MLNILRSRPDQKASVVSTEQRRGTLRLVPSDSDSAATQLLHLVKRQAQLNRAPCKICIGVLDYTMYILLYSGRLGRHERLHTSRLRSRHAQAQEGPRKPSRSRHMARQGLRRGGQSDRVAERKHEAQCPWPLQRLRQPSKSPR